MNNICRFKTVFYNRKKNSGVIRERHRFKISITEDISKAIQLNIIYNQSERYQLTQLRVNGPVVSKRKC